MTNEELCILAQSGNADAESELIDHLLPSIPSVLKKVICSRPSHLGFLKTR